MGLIGFFDILGYQNFLENNSATDSALEVLEIITDLPGSVRTIAKKISTLKEYKGCSDALEHLVFSDTIVLVLTYPDTAEKSWLKAARTFMAIVSSKLTAEMFKKGLPVRGVLHEGEFITKEMCFAGKGIVEAYKLCASLNYSSLTCTQFLGNKIIEDRKGKDLHNFFIEYLTPMKDGSEIKLLNFNWVTLLDDDEIQKIQSDIEGYVLNSFWKHNKDCSTSVDIKVHNTAKVMRKMLQHKLHS